MHQNPQALFDKAERAYGEARYEEARAALAEVEPVAPAHPAIPHLRALVERKLGNAAEARAAFGRAIRLGPGDPQIANNHANLLSDLGELESALAEYRRATRLAPHFLQARLNAAITLHQLGRTEEAREEFKALDSEAPNNPSVLNAWGAVERDAGVLAAAGRLFRSALNVRPDHPSAARNLARVARAQGSAEAAAFYRRAIELNPGDRSLVIEEAETRAAEGAPGAIDGLASLVRSEPEWTVGLEALARIRWEQGDREGYAQEIERALEARPRDLDLRSAYLRVLADSLQFGRAADVARDGQAILGSDSGLALSEAVYAGMAGDLERADRLFETLPDDAPNRSPQEARHRIRLHQFDRAASLLDEARAADPGNIAVWALTEVVWRAAKDRRSEWLSGQAGLFRHCDLALEPVELERLAEFLRGLHKFKARPLGQSLRAGTQTRYSLFDRPEPEIVRFREVLAAAVAGYLEQLPDEDAAHPLLRHRGARFRFTGSWSVRLTASGHHVSHIHPEGVLSSAGYVAVPALDDQHREGWLELGGPPADLNLDLDPLAFVRPEPGRLVLFPSYLFHGTRPFRLGERLTVAFDAAPASGR